MHFVRMLAEDKKDFIVVKLDIKNALNEISRAAILETLGFAAFEAAWIWAWSHVLKKFQTAEHSTEIDMALMWLNFLSQALFRIARRRGRAGKKGGCKKVKLFVERETGVS